MGRAGEGVRSSRGGRGKVGRKQRTGQGGRWRGVGKGMARRYGSTRNERKVSRGQEKEGVGRAKRKKTEQEYEEKIGPLHDPGKLCGINYDGMQVT